MNYTLMILMMLFCCIGAGWIGLMAGMCIERRAITREIERRWEEAVGRDGVAKGITVLPNHHDQNGCPLCESIAEEGEAEVNQDSTTTKLVGSWATLGPIGGGPDVEWYVDAALGDFAGEHDRDAIVREYRAEISDALPDGATLAGSDFYGPASRLGVLNIKIAKAVRGVDLWPIIERNAI